MAGGQGTSIGKEPLRVKPLAAHVRSPPRTVRAAARLWWVALVAALLGARAEAAAPRAVSAADADAALRLGWGADARPRHTRAKPRAKAPVRRSPAPQADRACLRALGDARVPFVAVGTLRGVRTPVEVVGPIGGVWLVPRAGRAARMDCQLARALAQTAPLLRGLRVDGLSFSGAYDYRRRHHSRRLSEHAHGLAIDVHAVHTAGGWFDVQRDFARDPGGWRPARAGGALAACVGAPASPAGRFLRTVTCSLALHPAFRYVLTPDYDGDHHNHFHLEAYQDGAEPLVASRPAERSATRSGQTGPRRR